MRGALEKMPGVHSAEVEPGKVDIKVAYDPAMTDVPKLLAGLQAAGESAKVK